MSEGFFEVGVVAGTVGLNGELRVFPTTDEPKRFSLLKEVFIDTENGTETFEIKNLRYHRQFVMLKLSGVDTSEQAGRLKGMALKIPPELALPLDENQYFHRDLLDMEVLLEDGAPLGVLSAIRATAANDVYIVKTPEGKEILIPAIKQCILNVDISGKKLTVRLLPGLLEL